MTRKVRVVFNFPRDDCCSEARSKGRLTCGKVKTTPALRVIWSHFRVAKGDLRHFRYNAFHQPYIKTCLKQPKIPQSQRNCLFLLLRVLALQWNRLNDCIWPRSCSRCPIHWRCRPESRSSTAAVGASICTRPVKDGDPTFWAVWRRVLPLVRSTTNMASCSG